MPVGFRRRTASNQNVFVAPDRATAVSLALNAGFGALGNVTIVGQIPVWPKLNRYINDNFLAGEPEYIWDSSISDGQSRGFAVVCESFQSTNAIQLLTSLTVFTDNAHEAAIEIYDTGFPIPTLVDSISPYPFPLTDGNMDPVTGYTEVQPYNWQTIRYFSGFSSTLAINTSYRLVVSFRAVNYNVIPPFAANPAGLAFVLDSYFIA
ncbi:hypothetical protein [Paenibacillus alvei]|uniref:Uncharacterized protein n=1 Tax=Paenibacillus alvei TaxID=44250 RepID=A0A383R8G5_PAEAL|nr:hypothetical protein [Paenibacillus alvei]SYX83437.1 conserved protein of unknown function [Paenibacillus alvei]